MLINTVTGQLDSNDLGTTLMHEHIFCIERNLRTAFSDWFDVEETLNIFCAEMEKLKSFGLKSFVDATPINLGRDVKILAEAANRSGIHILTCTGLYWHEYPFFNYGTDPKVLSKYLLREVTDGIEDTGIKPAFVKCASGPLVEGTPGNLGLVHGVGMTAAECNLPVYCHTDFNTEEGLYLQPILSTYVKEPWRIGYGHVFAGMKTMDYIKKLLDSGSYTFCDTIGFEDHAPMDEVAQMVADLCQQGYSKQIVLSTDHLNRSDMLGAFLELSRDRVANPILCDPNTSGRGIVFDTFIPKLRNLGVTQEHIDNMMIHNPRRYFECVAF